MSTSLPTLDDLPAFLAARDQWVAWKSIPDREHPEKKPKKLPIDPHTGTAASSTDPSTWGQAHQALAMAHGRRLAGVGAVVTREDGEAWVDADGCLDADGVVAEWWAEWHAALLPLAYAEVSPSGRGIKYWVRGQIADSMNEKFFVDGVEVGVECYSWGRYFTVTGRWIEGCADEPQEAQAVIDAIEARFRKAKPAPEVPEPAGRERQREAPRADLPPATGWRADRARVVDAQLREWVERKKATAQAQMQGAVAGELHRRRVQLGKLLGGVIAAAPGYLDEDEALSLLFGAKVPSSHVSTELKAIRDGLRYGDAAQFDADDMPTPPTDDDPVVRAGRACCPRCSAAIQRSRFAYQAGVVDEPGWYCPSCKGAMRWPLSAWQGPALVAPAAGAPADAAAPRRDGQPGQGGRFKAYRGAEIDRHVRPPRWLVRGYLALGAVCFLFGPSESGKTPLAVDLAEQVARHHAVIYVAAEDASGLRARMRAWELHHRVQRDDKFVLVPEALPLGDAAAVEDFIIQFRPLGARLLVLDTLSPCILGLDENSNSDMSVAMSRLKQIADALDLNILVLHHPTKDGGAMRGASALLNNGDAVITMEKGADDLIVMRQTRNKQGGERRSKAFRIIVRNTDMADDRGEPVEGVVLLPIRQVVPRAAHDMTPQVRELLQRIADAQDAGSPLGAAQLEKEAAGVGVSPSSFYRVLARLKNDAKFIEKAGEAKSAPYTVTPAGRKALAAEDAPTPTRAGEIDTAAWDIASTLAPVDQGATFLPPEVVDPSPYSAPDGYDEPPPDDGGYEPPGYGDAPTWDEPAAEPGPSVAQGMAERLRARQQQREEPNHHAAD